ncbi:MAG: GlsB/YeaQ/YmgE family stress response membrane protein [Acidobacteria bacterium]|nr:GlsB/YeaQ/YmgE family stress response membrane protein [Acidobacteriota bacterium]
MYLLWWIIVGLIAGWATGKIMRGSGYGALVDIIVGIAGAIVGGWIMRAIGFQGQGGTIYTVLVAIGGAVLLTWLYRLIIGPRGTSRGAGLPGEEAQGRSNLRKVA